MLARRWASWAPGVPGTAPPPQATDEMVELSFGQHFKLLVRTPERHCPPKSPSHPNLGKWTGTDRAYYARWVAHKERKPRGKMNPELWTGTRIPPNNERASSPRLLWRPPHVLFVRRGPCIIGCIYPNQISGAQNSPGNDLELSTSLPRL